MHESLIEILRCPTSGERLRVVEATVEGERIRNGWLVSETGHTKYRIKEFVPRFVAETNYADNFGMQWKKFRLTQLDSYSGIPVSANRFWAATNWRAEELAGNFVLDVGCGAGRFAEVALKAGAHVVAVDYSSAVDACYENLRHFPNLHVVQGNIYALPFQPNLFPFVYSLGVLQHTPDVSEALAALPHMVAPGGRLCVDLYRKSWRSALLPKYWLRPLTKRIPKERLFGALQRIVPILLPVSYTLGKVPYLGSMLQKIVPVADYSRVLPLSDTQLQEWALLDTFDWLSPEFDSPQTDEWLREKLSTAGLEQLEVLVASHLVGRGRKSHAPRH